ncbi:amidohydrolase family protein [Treponema primitia]|uniref:amidohydrolase family protein n=1 Tax=Treponema primitia TaxID=88058 RepID=UPI000C1FBD3F|nr:amidohydrolase family protein [Treponema primitia]
MGKLHDLGIVNAIIVSANFGYEPFIGSVAVKDGRIAAIIQENLNVTDGAGNFVAKCAQWIDGEGKILMPGLFNGHCHGDMTLGKGLGDGMTLGEQNEAFSDHNWFQKFITDEDRYYSRQLTYCEALLSGTTFLCENMYWSLGKFSAKAMIETGIRGALVEDVRRDFINQDDLVPTEDLRVFMEDCRRQGLVPIAGLPAEEDFETRRLLDIHKKLESLGLFRTMHLAETDWRIAAVETKYGLTPIDYLHQNKILNKYFIGSHVVHASDKEINQLKEDGVAVVNTPLCEMKIADGIAPIPEMVRRGITVCLGTDGAMWNNSNDIFREMKGMALLHSINSGARSLSPRDILNMATINGAKAFGVDADLGTIEPGKSADMILIETAAPHMQPLRLGKHENVLSNIVYSATGADVTDVFIGGKRIVENRVLKSADVKAIAAKVRQASEKIANALK